MTPGDRGAAELTALYGGNAVSHDHFVRQLVSIFARTLPGCAAASVTSHDSGSVVSVASHPDLERLHTLSRRQGQDPELVAVEQGASITINDTLTDKAWSDFCKVAVGHGIRSALIHPIVNGDIPTVLGLYGIRPATPDQVTLTRLIRQVEQLLWSAERHDDLLRTISALTAAQISRGVIDQAIGIIMGTRHCTREAAFTQLREMSNHSNTKLADVAGQLVGTWPSALGR